VDPTNVISAGEIVNTNYPTFVKTTKKGGIRSALEQLNSKDYTHGYVTDSKKQFLGIVTVDSLRDAIEGGSANEPIDTCYLKKVKTVNEDDNMQDILSEVASRSWPIPVVSQDNVFKGVVSKNRFLKTLHKSDQESQFA